MNGGVAAYVEPGSPFNKVAGLGFSGLPQAAALDALEQEFADRGTSPQFEVATLGDPALARMLTSRGCLLIGFENVLGLPIDPMRGLDVDGGEVAVTRASEAETAAWLDTVATGFLTPDVFDGPPGFEAPIPRDVLERVFGDTIAAPTFERYLARHGGAIAGGASLRIQDGIAQLSGAATLPEHRRRGVQSALLRHRLAEAARRGCDLAVVTTQPGSKSQENVQKFGFALLYARAILVKD
jgi:GNAT superfamily N-acetyltransferase